MQNKQKRSTALSKTEIKDIKKSMADFKAGRYETSPATESAEKFLERLNGRSPPQTKVRGFRAS